MSERGRMGGPSPNSQQVKLMNKSLVPTVLVLALLMAQGCASTPRAGEIVMQASVTEAHLTLPAGGVAVGDKVVIYRNLHTGRHGKVEKHLIGEGTVTRLMGDTYAAVEVPAGVEFRVGDYAERK